jgi:FkbM family methyltransferase
MQTQNYNTDKNSLKAAVKVVGNIRTIYDCGSRDALDGIELYRLMNAKQLHVFECNPPSIKKCRLNLEAHLGKSEENRSWFLCQSALNDKIGTIKFNQIDTEKTVTPHLDGNPGASSILVANKKYTKETYVQKQIDVNATTLNSYSAGKNTPDCLWLDLQGVELKVLKAANEFLANVKLIHLEVGFRKMYDDQCLYWELNEFLVENSFELFDMSIGRWPNFLGLYKLIGTGPWVGNAVYINKRFVGK